MLHTLRNQHFQFFAQKGFLELEELLPNQEATLLFKEIALVLAKRLGIEEEALRQWPALDLIKAGRDLWRDSPFLSSLVHKRILASFASALTRKYPLRLAFDQWVEKDFFSFDPSLQRTSLQELRTKEEQNLSQRKISLAEWSSVQGIACGLLFRLNESLSPSSQEEATIGQIFPTRLGNGSYIHADHPIQYEAGKEDSFYLIAYSQAKAIYSPNLKDPCGSYLKSLGYSKGDALKDQTHPIVFA